MWKSTDLQLQINTINDHLKTNLKQKINKISPIQTLMHDVTTCGRGPPPGMIMLLQKYVNIIPLKTWSFRLNTDRKHGDLTDLYRLWGRVCVVQILRHPIQGQPHRRTQDGCRGEHSSVSTIRPHPMNLTLHDKKQEPLSINNFIYPKLDSFSLRLWVLSFTGFSTQ